MPRSRLAPFMVAALALLAAVVIAFVLLRGGAQDPAASGSSGPSATPFASGPASTPPASPTGDTAPSPSEGGEDDDEALAVFAEIEQQVEAIRGLAPADIGPPDLITREELQVELRAIFDEEYPPEERERDNLALRAFGLLDEDQDVAELQLELLGEGVVGFYDDDEKRMVVVTETGVDAAAMVTYAHEYAHALQDEHFGLDSLEIDVEGEDDRGLARTALQEGDAQVTSIAWLVQHLTPEQQMELLETPSPDTSGIPAWMVAQLQFPYITGQFFVTQLGGGNIVAPDFTEVDAAFGDPPDSTEQVIHPEAWEAGEEPIAVEVPDIAGALGDGWEEVDETPVGEATIAIILEHFGATTADANVAAAGWGGDRSVVAVGPDGELALLWDLAWDEPGDAAEFVEAYEAVVEQLDLTASVTELGDGTVRVVHGTTPEIHDAIAEL